MPLLLFGVVRRGHPPLPSGGQDEDDLGVRLVESGDLAAAVSETDEQQELTEEDATRHLDILIMLLRGGPVLPLAFGTVSPDESAVRAEVLDAAATDLAQRLKAVDGYVEARLEIFFDEAAALREVMDTDAELRGLAAEARGEDAGLDLRISLGEAVSMRLQEWRQLRAEQLLPTLTDPVDSVAELEAHEPLQQRWAFLVRAERLGELDDAVGKLRTAVGQHGAVEYVGPLPVYSFLQQVQPDATPPRSAWGW